MADGRSAGARIAMAPSLLLQALALGARPAPRARIAPVMAIILIFRCMMFVLFLIDLGNHAPWRGLPFVLKGRYVRRAAGGLAVRGQAQRPKTAHDRSRMFLLPSYAAIDGYTPPGGFSDSSPRVKPSCAGAAYFIRVARNVISGYNPWNDSGTG
jgi:hypothetical protein